MSNFLILKWVIPLQDTNNKNVKIMKSELVESAGNDYMNQSACPRFFHVASEKYEVGDEIHSNNYQDKLDQKERQIETEIENLRPDSKPKRAESVFAFAQLSDAYVFLKRYGGYLYEVILDRSKLSEQQNTHISDMAIIELLKCIEDSQHRQKWIIQYWEGEMLYKPCIEVLIDKVIVKNILLHKEKPTIKELSSNCIHKYTVEYNTEYISLLNKQQSSK